MNYEFDIHILITQYNQRCIEEPTYDKTFVSIGGEFVTFV